MYIISLLCPKDLMNAAQTCRCWRTLCEDNYLWQEKCKEAGIQQGPCPKYIHHLNAKR